MEATNGDKLATYKLKLSMEIKINTTFCFIRIPNLVSFCGLENHLSHSGLFQPTTRWHWMGYSTEIIKCPSLMGGGTIFYQLFCKYVKTYGILWYSIKMKE